jgi:D-alanyl-D-alanine carboxypeptidase (penicillin-binding protein 5/6)
MKRQFRLFRIIVPLLAIFIGAWGPPAAALETPAREALLIDLVTGAVLLEKNIDDLVPPASMSKLMTVYMAFEELAAGRLKLDDTLPVSTKAWRMGGSKMFVLANDRIPVEDLLRGIVVQSGNDACVVLAEGLAGTEAEFAEQMTQRARELGLSQSTFKNSTGWPDPEHRMTVREIARLSQLIIEKFPQYYGYFAEKSFRYANITQRNRNPILGKIEGVDGLKTGHTQEAGFGIAVSAEREGRRLVLVITGLDSEKQRGAESARLIEWGFRAFSNYRLFDAGEKIESAEVWMGRDKTVPIVIPDDLTITMQRRSRRGMKVTLKYTNPIQAPVKQGDRIATLVLTAPEMETREIPLTAGQSVERKGLFGRIGAIFSYLVTGEP